jgi:hypothetical protein
MSDKQPMQAAGEGGDAKRPDGVNSAPPDGDMGGPYPNGVKGDKDAGGFFGHGGQTDIEYSGSDEGGKSNAGTD